MLGKGLNTAEDSRKKGQSAVANSGVFLGNITKDSNLGNRH